MTSEDLKEYKNTQKWINEQLEKYGTQKELAESIKSTVYDGMPKAKNKPNYALEELMDSIDEMLEILNNKQKDLNKIIKQLIQMKDTPKPYRSLLTCLYVNGLSLEETSVEINYSYQKTSTMHKIALKEFDKLHKEEKWLKNVKTS